MIWMIGAICILGLFDRRYFAFMIYIIDAIYNIFRRIGKKTSILGMFGRRNFVDVICRLGLIFNILQRIG